MEFYLDVQEKFKKIIKENNLNNEDIVVSTNILTVEEAIGIPERKDFPLLNGKEVLIQAKFKNAIGQAYTDSPSIYSGSIEEILKLDLSDNRNKVLFISALNAVLRYLKLIENTIHCKNEEPEECAKDIVNYIKDKYGNIKIGVVGFQPAIIENIEKKFSIRVLDLDSNNIGKIRYNTLIEDGNKKLEEVISWSDIMLVTGSTITNGSIVNFLELRNPVLFYGTTIAGAAYLKGLNRICFCSK